MPPDPASRATPFDRPRCDIAVADPQDSGAETLDALLQRADRALYAAKADGRDQVNCAGHAA